MDRTLRVTLLVLGEEKIANDDPSHDFAHAERVLALAERIAREEGADMDVVVPAAIFHDVVNHPKDDPRAMTASDESAELVGRLLQDVDGYPKEKIPAVQECIRECSFTKGIVPTRLESHVLQDADRLEATGAISIMRTFASSGRMGRPFYHSSDPFCEYREPEPTRYALDLFFARLTVVLSRMHTTLGKEIAKQRTEFLYDFLTQLNTELEGL